MDLENKIVRRILNLSDFLENYFTLERKIRVAQSR